MPILNRLILVLLLTLASGASCRCGLELLLEAAGCNPMICGSLTEQIVDDCCSEESTSEEDCTPVDPEGDECICCNGDLELAVMGRDELASEANDAATFLVPPADWPGAIYFSASLPARPGIPRSLGPPSTRSTLLRQRTLLQV